MFSSSLPAPLFLVSRSCRSGTEKFTLTLTLNPQHLHSEEVSAANKSPCFALPSDTSSMLLRAKKSFALSLSLSFLQTVQGPTLTNEGALQRLQESVNLTVKSWKRDGTATLSNTWHRHEGRRQKKSIILKLYTPRARVSAQSRIRRVKEWSSSERRI